MVVHRGDYLGAPAARISRRSLLRRGGAAFTGLAALNLLAACGDDDSSAGQSAGGGAQGAPAQLAGSVVFLNYPAWIGSEAIKPFEAKHPDVEIKEDTTALVESVAGTAVKVAQNPSAYDFLLADVPIQKQLDEGGFVYELDFSRIPNIENVNARFREAYPLGVPTDFGKIGFGYRKDIVKERPTTWEELWAIAPQYSRKITALNIDRDILGAALKYKGYSVNSVDEAELEAAKQAVLELKPHLEAFKSVEVAKGLVSGQTAIAITGDYDIALMQTEEPKIEWVSPEEGMPAYLEGWTAVSKTDNIDIFYEFANFATAPEQYAAAIEATGSSWVQDGIAELLPASMQKSTVIGTGDLDKVEFLDYIGADGTKLVSRVWNEIVSA
jgi:spermidine/putrescine transport system substrate-binding protein